MEVRTGKANPFSNNNRSQVSSWQEVPSLFSAWADEYIWNNPGQLILGQKSDSMRV